MKSRIEYHNWQAGIDESKVDSIGRDFILFDFFKTTDIDYPFKLDVAVAIICTKGTMSGVVNLKPFKSGAASLVIVQPGQILQHEHISDDFSGYIIIMSKQFIEGLQIIDKLPSIFSFNANPAIFLGRKGLEVMLGYYASLKRVVKIKDHPHRMEIVKHLTLVIFYGLSYRIQEKSSDEKKTRQNTLVDNFLKEVHAHYKEQRGVEFYADKLCLTPKYLSTLVKKHSGKSANEWIDEFVLLEARALLKSTNLTVSQVSLELNFPSQSFFGRYFKRHMGISPKEYKKS